ncbi:ATP-dependent protease ATPase subunit HslU [Pumilibacter intestinalis]|uniref:ATP-dependent protease ATPase subunit HslU n=1 Tax=Pumilibacter intestinalis TaxID=2941511 RepID=UPI00203D45B4|nr:ATP-dependent protease ATPase subunit HslU [Pumilibacter intestinalis]
MELSPKQVVAELDKYIIGQADAKKAVAVALRNRYRRSMLPDDIREEITPKNIIMKGPTGVGKTEIARRLAKLVKAPFIKVEATKFTEVGYVGRDVESMIRDLAEVAVRLVKEEKLAEVEVSSKASALKKITDALYASRKKQQSDVSESVLRAQIEDELKSGKLDNHMLEIEVNDMPKPMEIMPGSGAEINIGDIFGNFMPKKRKKRKLSVKEAMKILTLEEAEKHIDMDAINSEGIKRAEQQGVIFIDEIDKIAGKGASSGPDVSREGVQRDILPIVEGCTVMTKYGALKTDYILFIASGAFHVSAISDLIPEFQGRFPVCVELNSLTADDFVRILTETENAITRQYAAMLGVDNINLSFNDEAIRMISEVAVDDNNVKEDIGARRLHTIMESLLEDLSFNASGDHPTVDVKIDKKYVEEHLGDRVRRHNLKKYIL